MNSYQKWNIYELEKKIIQSKNLSYEEYERQIRELIDKLKI